MSEGISPGRVDREFESFGGKQRPTTFRRVEDPNTAKLAQLFELYIKGVDVFTLQLVTDNDGNFVTDNFGNLVYY